VFFNGEPVGLPKTPHEPPRWMRVPVEVLVFLCLAVGIFPTVTIGPLLAVAARSTLGGTLPDYSLAIWHGVNAPLLMSLVATAAGVGLYFGLHRFVNLHTVTRLPAPGRQAFDAAMGALQASADRAIRVLPFGALPRMLTWLVVAAVLAGAWPLIRDGFGSPSAPAASAGPGNAMTGGIGIAIWLLGIGAAVAATVRYRQRFLALIFLGVTGLMVSLAFVLLSAPDLALTQLLVEVVTIVLMMLVLHFLPQTSPPEPAPGRRWRDGVIAGAAGTGIAGIAYAVLTRPFDSIAPYYLENSVSAGGGTNAVNVIIVDFRGFDTMGEIAVLGLGGLIVHALLAGVRIPAGLRPERPASGWNPLLVQVVARTLLPLAALAAVYLFLRGHNLPGGGFIAGLVLAAAIVVTRVAGGSPLPKAPGLAYSTWVGVGLAAAGLTGIGSWALGYPFLTSAYGHPVLPLVGEVPLATAGLFDLGVFLTVVGATLLLLMVPGLLEDPPGSGAEPPR
jgi:multicomponent K+:H+ antiporter subunit A